MHKEAILQFWSRLSMTLFNLHVMFFNCALDEAYQTHRGQLSPDSRNKCSKPIKDGSTDSKGIQNSKSCVVGCLLQQVNSLLF